uniref:Reverse transcriptase zinc-binding domain-containing protein n=1 Tax=Ananas comosus var. bracteatus TaxID=296719 RepID=A0A6V7Q0L2_ANACO|nr:unnamed protein product [Ananas comosus var. bracteatus]
MRDARATKLWRLLIPLKVKVFCWLILKKRPITADNLLKRGWTGNTTCVLCGMTEETVDHLFTQCVFTRFLMALALENLQSTDLGHDVISVWDKWTSRKSSLPSSSGIVGLIYCLLVGHLEN